MKNLFKSLTVVGLLVATSLCASATSFSTNIVATGVFQFTIGSAKVTQLVISAPANNTTAIAAIDTSTNSLTNIVSAYSNTASYQTNLITTWTNYYGVVDSFTNVAQVSYSNFVAAVTNFYPTRIAVNVGTNQTVKFDQVNYYFNSGVLVTNTGAGTATVTITYQQ